MWIIGVKNIPRLKRFLEEKRTMSNYELKKENNHTKGWKATGG